MPGEAAKIELPVESVLAPPAKKGGTLTLVGEGGWGFEVSANAKNKDVGIEFLKFMCTYDAQYLYAGIYGGTMTSCIPVMDSDIFAGDDPVKRSIRRHLKALANTAFYGWGFGLPGSIEDIVAQACEKVRTGEMQPAEAAKEMQARMEEHRQQWLEGKLPTPEE
jgi:ABC-type glycerol-3-phosphate transport system substrate-binding protein